MHFRILRTLDDLVHAERLQEEVFGVTERDLIPANELIVVPETGGAVIAAFLPDDPDRAAGVLLGWGGFVGRPRVVSDFLAVRPEARGLGLATELKRLQAGIALHRGFEEIVWTVDPLRAANARLNFGKLGAVAWTYEIDRYGSTFATGLYGGMPSDRLHVTWDLAAPRVVAKLLGRDEEFPTTTQDPPPVTSGMSHDADVVTIPADIDALLTADPAEAIAWRFRLRETLIQAFSEGFVITGFRPAVDAQPAYLLERVGRRKD
ncbi:MAG: GNAT family N-acetyltransferase [Chloroflexi bacterium]|nr:GNAT family N-acetyltransferase [Chloroflexota bacterium]